MASNKCAREECGKTVYPTEELKCLDKVWHKGCFRCTTCGTTLSMKSYKGFEKKPYCEAHYPKTVPSAVFDTPAMIVAKKNTANQSTVKYHEQYEKMRGTKIEVADDPETKRLLGNTINQSLAHYHGEMRKKEDQDQQRSGQPEQNVHSAAVYNSASSAESTRSYGTAGQPMMTTPGSGGGRGLPQPQFGYGQKKQEGEDKEESPYSQRVAKQAQGTMVYSSERGGAVAPNNQKMGSIADYDPMRMEPQAQQQPTMAHISVGGPAMQISGFTVKAVYDYTAADKDEVSFQEGDFIVNCQKVDDGWLTGTVQRTLEWGMLPANYVEIE